MWMQRDLTDTPILWEPQENAGLVFRRFQKTVEEKEGIQFDNYWDFQKWSVNNVADFWELSYKFFGVIHSKKYYKVLDLNVPMSECPKWFEGARLNYAENLLKFRNDEVALILAGEDRETEKVTFAEMFKEAELYAAAFGKCGLKKNDVVVCYMSNRKEAVFAMQAVVSIGAIWTGALPLMGAQPVLSRFENVKSKILITVDRFMNAGEEIDMLPKIKTVAQGLSSLQKVIIVPSNENSTSKDIRGIPNSCFLGEFLKLGRLEDGSVPPMEFEQVSFSHPVFISYTSGTTGPSKPIVHGTGILLGICHYFGCIDNEREVRFSVAPVGWAAWIIIISLNFIGNTVVLYEGSPFLLSPTSCWDLVDEFKLTSLFLPSSTLDELQKRGYTPQKQHKLSTLKAIMVAGSPVKPQNYDFVREIFNKRVILTASYGCTEIMGGCINSIMTLPTRRGEIAASALGNAVQVVNDLDEPLVGEIGELVITKSIPSLALGLWGDTDGSLFREKYFSKHPGMFTMGDYGILNPITKGFIICGRSDETLKQRGCRFGSSEIYNVVYQLPEIHDCLCVSQYNKDLDERAVLFVKMREGHSFSIQLLSKIRETIANELSIRHIPDVILETKDIPYNMSGKKMEIIVKKIINKIPHTIEAVTNRESLDYYHNVPELQLPF
ncbi:hypothetical protein JTE90_016428 [Oedothorax gibbosus]|uniref:Acetoacetyl-CoA synthetase n=1 Tax=Oedothorax gibbosus TaxID=931172 RepID=A0AAV6TWV7_9ARAC|nr:hypothetical protein JTE90_016428 [Oedothorax gibbosus]